LILKRNRSKRFNNLFCSFPLSILDICLHTMPPAEKKESTPSPTNTPPPCPSLDNTVIIFDWDDTLLASSFLSSRGYRLESTLERTPDIDAQLKDLEQSVCAVLKLASSYGHVHIVTNAETGWVQLSAQKFIPGVVPLLEKFKVVSARSTYESMFPDCPLKWKFYAFQEKLNKTFGDLKSEKNVISFGDSHVEREAVRAVTKGFSNTRTKSVKFAERPSMEQLRRQIELVTNCFHYIIQHDGDLDLQLTVTVNTSGQTPPASPTVKAQPSPSTPSSAAPQTSQSSTSSSTSTSTSTTNVNQSSTDKQAPKAASSTCRDEARDDVASAMEVSKEADT
jgi:hypothetical protein